MKTAILLANQAHKSNQTVVLVTGVFDVLHSEHQHFLRKAAGAGDILLVGVESDERVRQLKGKGRPINAAEVRVKQLSNLKIADHVFVLPTDFEKEEARLELLKKIRPQVLAVSAHTPNIFQKRQLMSQIGGVVRVVHEYNPLVSTTLLINDDKLNS